LQTCSRDSRYSRRYVDSLLAFDATLRSMSASSQLRPRHIRQPPPDVTRHNR
jgi:hypothetical protein